MRERSLRSDGVGVCRSRHPDLEHPSGSEHNATCGPSRAMLDTWWPGMLDMWPPSTTVPATLEKRAASAMMAVIAASVVQFAVAIFSATALLQGTMGFPSREGRWKVSTTSASER